MGCYCRSSSSAVARLAYKAVAARSVVGVVAWTKLFHEDLFVMVRKRVVTLSWNALDDLCEQLACKITALYGEPMLVVGISRPGYEVARRVAVRWTGVPVVMANSQRGLTPVKRSFIINALLKRIPRRVADMLRIAESSLCLKRKKPRRVEIPEMEFQISPGEMVLIVDDSADSGATLAGAIRVAGERWPGSRIITATITTTRSQLLVHPDVSLMPECTLVRLPWAIDAGK